MATIFEDLKQGLQEVDDFLGGKRAGFKVSVPAKYRCQKHPQRAAYDAGRIL